MPEVHQVTLTVTASDRSGREVGTVLGTVHTHLDQPKWKCACAADGIDPQFEVVCRGEHPADTWGEALEALIEHHRRHSDLEISIVTPSL